LVGKPATECNDGRLLVAPGEPVKSYLVDKLLGTSMCSGDRMPEVFPYLPDDQMRLIRDWICKGVAND
jgi:hypothetical protein